MGLLLFGLFFSHLILLEFQHQLHHTLRIQTPEEDQDAYDKWRNNDPSTYDANAAPEYWRYYFWNLTNAEGVALRGELPHFAERGPYTYREYKEFYNVTFSDDHSTVKYNERTQYTWNPDMSCAGCAEDDLITNVNPTLATLYVKAGSTLAAQAFVVAGAYAVATSAMYEGLAQTGQFGNCTTPSEVPLCQAAIAAHVVNGTAIGSDASHPFYVGPGASWVSNPSYKAIFTGPGLPPSALLWYQVTAEAASRQAQFPEFFFAGSGVTNVSATKHFLFGPTGPTLACTLGDQTSPEPGVACATYFLEQFQIYVLGQHIPAPMFAALGGVKEQTAFGIAMIAYAPAVLAEMSRLGGGPLWHNGTAGLAYARRNVHQWLFEYDDVVARLQGATGPAANTAFFPLNASTNAESWRRSQAVTVVTTGKSDLDQIDSELGFESHLGWLPAYDAVADTGYFCAGDAPIRGTSDRQPIGPGTAGFFSWKSKVTDKSEPAVWVDDPNRPIVFTYRQDTEFKGIKTLRYQIKPGEFDPKPEYDMHRVGVLNMTCAKHGTPVQYTQPHFAGANLSGGVGVGGIGPVDEEKHLAFLDVEPVTGATLIGYERLQINLHMESEWITDEADSSSNFTANGKLIPVFWVEDSAHMSDQQADDFKSTVYAVLKIHLVFLILFCALGGLMVIAGPLLWYWGRRAEASSEGDYLYLGSGQPQDSAEMGMHPSAPAAPTVEPTVNAINASPIDSKA